MKLIEDLGMLYATKKSKRKYRYGLYECPNCMFNFKAISNSVNTKHTTQCRSCATSNIVNKKLDKFTKDINLKTLREFFNYKDGNLIYKKKTSINIKIGDIVGSKDKLGYYNTKINNKSFKVHRLIWIWHNDIFNGEIDHKDHNPSNNRIKNLRIVSHKENMKNKKLRKDNTSGTTGVKWNKSKEKWEVYLSKKYYGAFKEKQKAISKRKEILLDSDYHQNHGKDFNCLKQ